MIGYPSKLITRSEEESAKLAKEFIANITNGERVVLRFVMTRGKGGTDKMRTILPNGTEIVVLTNKIVRRLKNTDKYPVVVLGECNHGIFDVSLLNFLKLLKGDPNIFRTFKINDCIPEGIAWQFVKQADSGAIAMITNTNFCYGDLGDKNHNDVPDDAERFGGFLATDVFKQYGQNGEHILGKIFFNTLKDYVETFPVSTQLFDCKSVQEWTLFGDPSRIIGGRASISIPHPPRRPRSSCGR